MIKQILESLDTSEFGIRYEGKLITLEIGEDSNGISRVTIKGNEILKFPSYSELIRKYDIDEDKLGKIYKQIFSKYSKKIEKIAKDFESEIIKNLKDLESEIETIIN